MNTNHLFVCLAAALAFSSCTKDDPEPTAPDQAQSATVRLVIRPYWGGAPFHRDSIEQNIIDQRILVQDLKFYLGNVGLIRSDGICVQLFPIDLFSLIDGEVMRSYPMPEGDYVSIGIGIGVPPALNATDPVLYANEHPLSASQGMYWSWASAYRFVIFDGRFDPDPNGVGLPPNAFSLHTGLDTCYRTIELAGLGLNVPASGQVDVELRLNVDRIFYSSTDTLDLEEGGQTHGDDIPLAIKVSDLFMQAIELD